ncbi:MAG: lipopolysaccharide heptosyltransferase II [Piscirickettsiaceae bacterium]|nr:lipopolysaccharide heptosyltransferase II [Piscirickettsiaceae bacterium]
MQSDPYKILIIGPSWIGDMVMAQSLFMALKAERENCVIDVLALAWTKPLLDRMPEVNQAIPMPISHGVFGLKMRRTLGKQLQATHYDQAIVLPNSWKSALIPWFAKIPLRTGWKGEARYGLLNDIRTLDKLALPLMVQRFVSLAYPAEQSQIPPSYPTPKMVANKASFAVPPLTSGQKRLIICPGAEFGPAKQWPAESYAEVTTALIDEGWQVLVLGSAADKAIADQINDFTAQQNDNQLINLCGLTQLQDAIDLLATANAVISNDSGLMHIAAALQKPLIAIYGPTSPNFTPPLSDNSVITQIDVDCGPCFQRTCPEQHHKCMVDISSSDVLTSVRTSQSQSSH